MRRRTRDVALTGACPQCEQHAGRREGGELGLERLEQKAIECLVEFGLRGLGGGHMSPG